MVFFVILHIEFIRFKAEFSVCLLIVSHHDLYRCHFIDCCFRYSV